MLPELDLRGEVLVMNCFSNLFLTVGLSPLKSKNCHYDNHSHQISGCTKRKVVGFRAIMFYY